ncbi:MAG: DUF561 domain-containing protein [Candidatus Gastranaerophilales bacterium]|nr:DUF561 domain-containing protein [Candidatus Gastranaerophilales bacterium]
MGIEIFKKHLREKRAIKIITGMNNYNTDSVAKICRAAQNGKASAVEVVCDKKMYDTAKKNTKLPIFVSSIHPFKILEAVKWGAEAIDIGNFHTLNKKGQIYTSHEIYDIVLETLGLINDYDVFVSVTIPSYIDIKKQIELVKKIELLNVDLIQVYTSKIAMNKMNLSLLFSNYGEAALQNAFELTNNCTIPIMNGIEMSSKLTKDAFNTGASAIAIDSAVNMLETEVAMTMEIQKAVAAISHRNSFNNELIRTNREMMLNL